MRLRMLHRPERRALLSACAAAVMSIAAMSPARAGDPVEPPHVVQDPHYGDTLFQFYQGRYFTAVTGLMVSQHFGRVSHHADEAEVLRGGLLLSYGLHREAGEIFAKLIEHGASPSVRDRAWFYLAKIRYQRGFVDEAFDAIGRIEGHLPPDLEEERLLLQANLQMARGDYAGAASTLAASSKPGSKATATQQLYARFNLGIALLKSGDEKAGTELLDEVGRVSAPDEEYRSLRDKANVALGYAALQEDKPEGASVYLQRVRLNSLHSNKALLGFGWAAASLKDYKHALVPWTELATRDASDAAVLEARIAVPYAYAELGAYGQALERYNEAIAAYERESRGLDESIAAIRAGKLVDGLIERNPGEEMGWFWNIRELPDMPHAAHLSQVLAEHEFQEAFKNYRDLRFLSRNLDDWASSLGVYRDMLANRRRAYAERLPQVRAKAQASGLQALQQRGDALAREVEQAESDNNGALFADARQRELMARLDRVRATLDQSENDAETEVARERHRLAAGALTWELAQDYPARFWEAKKAVKNIQAQIGQARRSDAALAQAQKDEPAKFDAFATRIGELDRRIQALAPRVAALTREEQQAVQDIAIASLEKQKERLAVYATQARFAVAQLYDRASVSRKADDASAQ